MNHGNAGGSLRHLPHQFVRLLGVRLLQRHLPPAERKLTRLTRAFRPTCTAPEPPAMPATKMAGADRRRVRCACFALIVCPASRSRCLRRPGGAVRLSRKRSKPRAEYFSRQILIRRRCLSGCRAQRGIGRGDDPALGPRRSEWRHNRVRKVSGPGTHRGCAHIFRGRFFLRGRNHQIARGSGCRGHRLSGCAKRSCPGKQGQRRRIRKLSRRGHFFLRGSLG